MKRTQIGNTEVNRDSNYFVLDTPLWQMRQSEVRIMSYLDLLQESANFATTDSEILRIYNEMDKYYCVAKIIENLGDNEAYLINAFYVYNEALQKGEFDRIYIDMLERNNHINELVCNIVNDSINYTVNDTVVIDQELFAWWQDNVINQNFYTDPRTGDKTQVKPDSLPVSIAGEVDYISTFKQSAVCYTYTVVSMDAIKESSQARLKRKKQNEIRNALGGCEIQLDITVQENYIKSGIMAATNGGSAYDFVNAMKRTAKKKSSIGEPISAAVATIIAAAITFLTTLVASIFSYRASRLGAEAKQALQNGDRYSPSANDFLNIDLDGDGRNDLPKILLIGAAALALYYFM